MIEMDKPKLECVVSTANYGKFVVEPLERGFGTTLGNSMRRVLLSSLPGVAATSIRIDGVLHEFSTIEGVKEDVTEIILNLKQLICKLHTEEPKKVVIDAVGPCEVKAGDILPDADVEIINPELHLATIDANGRLHMEIVLASILMVPFCSISSSSFMPSFKQSVRLIPCIVLYIFHFFLRLFGITRETYPGLSSLLSGSEVVTTGATSAAAGLVTVLISGAGVSGSGSVFLD